MKSVSMPLIKVCHIIIDNKNVLANRQMHVLKDSMHVGLSHKLYKMCMNALDFAICACT